ncbi:MAG: hypothetical protein ACREA2_16135 [Blastocatellia bacterium]
MKLLFDENLSPNTTVAHYAISGQLALARLWSDLSQYWFYPDANKRIAVTQNHRPSRAVIT